MKLSLDHSTTWRSGHAEASPLSYEPASVSCGSAMSVYDARDSSADDCRRGKLHGAADRRNDAISNHTVRMVHNTSRGKCSGSLRIIWPASPKCNIRHDGCRRFPFKAPGQPLSSTHKMKVPKCKRGGGGGGGGGGVAERGQAVIALTVLKTVNFLVFTDEFYSGRVAQWIARWSSEPKVPGSSPGMLVTLFRF